MDEQELQNSLISLLGGVSVSQYLLERVTFIYITTILDCDDIVAAKFLRESPEAFNVVLRARAMHSGVPNFWQALMAVLPKMTDDQRTFLRFVGDLWFVDFFMLKLRDRDRNVSERPALSNLIKLRKIKLK